jgi:hypothetical protein
MRSVTLQPPTGLSDEAARITPRHKAGRCSRKSGKLSVPHADLTGPHLNISKDAIDDATDEAFYVRPPGGSQSRLAGDQGQRRDQRGLADQAGYRLWIASRRVVGEKTARKRAMLS